MGFITNFDWVLEFTECSLEAIVQESTERNKLLLRAFDADFSSVTFNNTLYNRISAYANRVLTRTGNVEWLGSNLLGTEQIRFYDTDRFELFDEVLVVDEDVITESLAKTDLEQSWNVAGDTFNVTCIYVLHRLWALRNDKNATRAAIDLLRLLQFKFYSSMYFNFFSKPVDLPAAEAAYAALSYKFAIKQLGNWGAVLTQRAEYFFSKESVHYKTLDKFDNTGDIVYYISDLHTRIKQTIKFYYGVLDDIRSKNLRITTQSADIVLDGERIIRDKTNALADARRYLHQCALSYNSFYKLELVNAVNELVPTASNAAVKDVLGAIANISDRKAREQMDELMTLTLEYTFEYVVENRLKFNDAHLLLLKMSAIFKSPKTKDPRILKLRTEIERFVKKNSHVHSSSAVSAVRTAVLLYFILRAVSIKMYD